MSSATNNPAKIWAAVFVMKPLLGNVSVNILSAAMKTHTTMKNDGRLVFSAIHAEAIYQV
jgi:hypothetical protein